MTAGYIYFGGYGDAIKIGKSIKPVKRIANLNGANPENVILYAVVATADMGLLEKRIHKHFEQYRREGKREWYYSNPELKYVCTELYRLDCPTEYDLGRIIGTYHTAHTIHQQYKPIIASLTRKVKSALVLQIEQWAMGYAIRAMRFWQHPIFTNRYNEAIDYLKTLEPDEVPVFITDRYGNLLIGQDEIDTQAA